MSTFLNALNQKNNEHIPVWFMRQAGRYLPEYMAIKNKSNFREMSHTPKLMSEITIQPLERYPLDAAIMFSDILTCLEFMGSTFEFRDSGPKLDDHGPHVLKKLTSLNPEKDLHFVGEGIRSIRKSISVPLIGFVGAPFTLISYLVEGGTSKEFITTKRLLLSNPLAFSEAMTFISTQLFNYLSFQVECGAQAVQIFDSWVGVLSASQYEKHILPHMCKLIEDFKNKNPSIPVILYSQPSSHLFELLSQTKANAISVDWRSPLSVVAKRVPSNITLQGNLDPIVTTLDWSDAKPYVDEVLQHAKNAEILNRYIFNVGHGVTPHTQTETLKSIIDYVHEFK